MESIYEQIRALISRNDFITAEKLMRKYDTDLTKNQRKELHKFFSTQQKLHIAVSTKNRRLDSNIHWRIFSLLKKIIIVCWCILSLIILPYRGMQYYAYLYNKRGGPPVYKSPFMESLFLLNLTLVILFIGLQIMDTHRLKNAQRDKANRTKDNNLFYVFDAAEKSYTRKEKDWLFLLVFFIVWLLFKLDSVYMS